MTRVSIAMLLAVAGLGCQNALSPSVVPGAAGGSTAAGNGVELSATGGGQYDAGVIVQFSMSATQRADGTAEGRFHHKTALGGLPIEFHGTVTCMAVDRANGRAWIGGVVTKNNSEHASFTTPIHDVGRDIWFRVLDSGEGQSDADRTTFVGFEGGGGIATSAEYCAAQIWPNDPPNDRTSPLTAGNIQVH